MEQGRNELIVASRIDDEMAAIEPPSGGVLKYRKKND
jgi:hypothetical protein